VTLTVVKVGGGLLGGAAELQRVVSALATRRRAGERLLVVASALRGVTDALDRAARSAIDPRAGAELERDLVETLRRRHEEAGGEGGAAAGLGLRASLDGVARLLTGVRLTGELTERTRAQLLAHGERLAAPLLAESLRGVGTDARALHSEEAGIVARGPHAVGSCDLAATEPGLQCLTHELHDRILVLTGFYGLDDSGDVVLFGRGGTDYTAGVVAAGLGAARLELWKDVPGFLSADPREVPSARLVPELSFDEACELGYYGARILHPRCLEPLRGRALAVRVRPVEGDADCGTAIVDREQPSRGVVSALAHRSGVAVVTARGASMVNQPGVAGRVLSAVGQAGVNVDGLAASMTTVSFTVAEEDASLVRRTLRLLASEGGAGFEDVEVRTNVALVGLVGDGVAADPSIPARALSCLAALGHPVELISHGPSDVGLTCVVPRAALRPSLAALHRTFFESRVSSST
jgi:aspartate kinase